MKKATLTPFEQALLDVNLEEFESIPAETKIDISISSQFQSNAEKLIRKTDAKSFHGGSMLLRRVALVALIAGLLALTACAIPEVREAIIDFFFRDEGTHYEFTYDPEQAANAPDLIETVYLPTYVPAGFELMSEDISIAGVSVMRRNPDNIWLNYIQYVIPYDPTLGDGGGFNSEGTTTEWIKLGDCLILRTEDDEWINYIWTSSEYQFSISCSSKSLEEEMQKVFYSIRIDEDAVIFGAD